ncbi:Tat pathway signal sequence domain protein [Sphingomonas sanguinis]|uniref:DUF6250 domain-containing protein n=1 Tax=Sphingomonas sanguinis TaxID=33051 RepID=UPI001C585C13|nr:DUF6250 domain-containing protein [Sphingomonas sanguinis]QXT35966.1 Tat pathway signal sequence domain protein [Sphingomonas sanguinis]
MIHPLFALAAVAAPVALQADGFRGNDLSRWRIEAEPGARISARNGILDIDAVDGVTLWYARALTGPVAIDYEVMAVQAGGPHDAVSDVNAFWMARDPAVSGGSVLARPRDGRFASYDGLETYYVGIGGNRNTTTRMRRYVGRAGDRPLLPEHDLGDRTAMLVPNRWMHIRLIANGNDIAVERDGRRLFTMQDAAPYRQGWFGLRTTRSHLRVRHMRITPLPR